jgi:hypothetical protein
MEIQMKPDDNVSVTFVNTVIGRGILNGVVNLSFGVFNFTPNEEGTAVDLDPSVACRLRMDKVCATQLRDVMNELLTALEKAEHSIAAPKEEITEGLVPKRAESIN